MNYLTWDHQEQTRKLEDEFSQFKRNNREAMTLLYIVASDPELEDGARKSLDDDNCFQIRLFKQQTQDFKGANKVFASLAVALFSKDSFPLDMLEVLDNDQLDIALEAIRYCYKDEGGIYDIDESPMILKESTATAAYMGQTQVADMMQDLGLDGDRRKVSVYQQRGHMPEPDVMIGKAPGWKKEVIQKWIEDYEAGKIVERRKRK